MTKLQTWTMAGLGTMALIVGILLASGAITSAQTGDTPTPTPAATEEGANEGTGHWCGGGANPLVFDNAGEILGLTQEELREARRSGQTLAEIAQAHGMSVADFESALLTAVTADLQTQLGAGDITQERYDSISADLDAKISAIINSEGGFHRHGRHLVRVLGAAAEVLGLSEDDLSTALEDGQTLAQIAEAQGMTVEDFKAALTANITADLQAKLDAGEITQEQFDDVTAGLSEKLDEIINREGGIRFHGPGRGFGDGARFRNPASGDSTIGTDA